MSSYQSEPIDPCTNGCCDLGAVERGLDQIEPTVGNLSRPSHLINHHSRLPTSPSNILQASSARTDVDAEPSMDSRHDEKLKNKPEIDIELGPIEARTTRSLHPGATAPAPNSTPSAASIASDNWTRVIIPHTLPHHPYFAVLVTIQLADTVHASTDDLPDETLTEAAAEGWRSVYDALVKQDEKTMKGYQEDIDALLILAGLFSAVLTAFIVEAYKNLQEDYTKTSKTILMTISRQISDPSVSHISDSDLAFGAASSDLRVNIMWFISLILSLSCALFGIFAKQWIRSYLSWSEIARPIAAVRVRQYRYEGMKYWKFKQTLNALPVLLQMALVLFTVGLVDFCLELHKILGYVVCAIASVALAALMFTSFMPLNSPSFPYRSPWSIYLAQVRHMIIKYEWAFHVWLWLQRIDRGSFSYVLHWMVSSKLSAIFNWNRLDEYSVSMHKILAEEEDNQSYPKFDARSICSLLKFNCSDELVLSALCCVTADEIPERQIHLLHVTLVDVCHMICCIYGMEMSPRFNIGDQFFDPVYLESTRKRVHSTGMTNPLQRQIFRLLRHSIVKWNPMTRVKDQRAVRDCAMFAIDFMQYLRDEMGPSIKFESQLECLHAFSNVYNLRIHQQDDGEGAQSSRQKMASAYFRLLLSLGCGVPKSGLRSDISDLVNWSPSLKFMSKLTKEECRRLAVDAISEMQHSSGGPDQEDQISIGVLSDVVDWITVLHSVRGEEMDSVAQFLQQLDAWVARFGSYYRSTRGPIYWQALYILASTHQNLFPERLVHQLYTEAAMRDPGNVNVNELALTARVAVMDKDEIWDLFLSSCRRIGSEATDWSHPQFDPWMESRSVHLAESHSR